MVVWLSELRTERNMKMDEIISELKAVLIEMNGLAMGLMDDYLPMLNGTAQKVHDAIVRLEEMTCGEGDG